MEKKEKIYKWLFVFFTICVFIFLLIRASQFSFSEDEAFSLLDVLYMKPGYFFGNIPNTHLLNSGFLWLELKCFGFQEIFLRIHSVLSFLVFAWVVYKFSKFINSFSLRIVFLFAILLHPFMLTYFSMARGYAMSIAFMMLSLYFLYQDLLSENRKVKRQIYTAFFWAALSVVSCYVMFTFYLALLIFYAIDSLIIKNPARNLQRVVQIIWLEKIFWITHFIFSLVILYLVMKLKPSSLHEFWPYNSFWGDTIYSLVETTFKHPNQVTLIMFIIFVMMIAYTLVISFIYFYKKRNFSPPLLFVMLFIIIALLLVTQYYLFHITYISYRGAIFLYPLIILMIFWAMMEMRFSIIVLNISKGFVYLFTLGLVINFGSSFSLNNGIGIVSKNGFVQALSDVRTLQNEDKKISLGVSRAFPATIYYYILRDKLEGIKNIGFGYEPETRNYLFYGKEKIETGKYDYFIIEEPDISIISQDQKIMILKKYPDSRIVLAKPFD